MLDSQSIDHLLFVISDSRFDWLTPDLLENICIMECHAGKIILVNKLKITNMGKIIFNGQVRRVTRTEE